MIHLLKVTDSTKTAVTPIAEKTMMLILQKEVSKESEVDAAKEHKEHVEHVFHQLQNKPWAALYVACIFYVDFIRSFSFSMQFNKLLKQVGLQFYLE